MAYLGIKISSSLKSKLPSIQCKMVKSTDYHITLLRFDNIWSIDEFIKSIDVVSDTILDVVPFSMRTTHISSFETAPNQPYPIVSLIQSDYLCALQKRLLENFNKNSIGYFKYCENYNPHITLGYSKNKIIMDLPVINIQASELILLGGDTSKNRAQIYFPLPHDEDFVNSQKEIVKKVFKYSNESLNLAIDRRVNPR